MKYRVAFRPEAVIELTDAVHFYEEQAPGLGNYFLLCVEAGIASIERSPYLYPRIYRTIRRALVRRFPYGVYYLIDQDKIMVLAVFHAKRNPMRWKRRY